MKTSAFLAVAVLALSAPAALAAQIATVVSSTGQVTINGHAASTGEGISEHAQIAVSVGTIQILFSDGTKMALGDGSKLVVEKYLMQGGGGVSNFTVDALSGTFRFITGKSKKSAYDIKTADATIGIRGTGFDIYSAGVTGVTVLEGTVRLCRNGGGCVDLANTCETGVTHSGGANRLTGIVQGENLRSKFPFIVNQKRLKPSFRLPVGKCDKVLKMPGRKPGGSGPSNPVINNG